MKAIAKFEKVSFRQFAVDTQEFLNLPLEELKEIYESIKLPRRATLYSAGYDFFTYCDLVIKPGETKKIPTGIRCKIDEDYVLLIAPRSSLGFKYRLQLDNTIGVIDADYYNAKNQGHIFIKITNDTKEEKTLSLSKFEAFAQGIFIQYGLTVDDDVTDERIGGFGSTNR